MSDRQQPREFYLGTTTTVSVTLPAGIQTSTAIVEARAVRPEDDTLVTVPCYDIEWDGTASKVRFNMTDFAASVISATKRDLWRDANIQVRNNGSLVSIEVVRIFGPSGEFYVVDPT